MAKKPAPHKKYLDFNGRMVMVGFGSIGQGVLPLILRHINIKPEQIVIITDEMRGGEDEARRYGVEFVEKRLTVSNYRSVLDNRLGEGDFLVNLSVEVASTALIELCQKRACFTSTPASSPGRAVIRTPTCRSRAGRTMRCATPC